MEKQKQIGWKKAFIEEFGIHFISSKGELRFALGFISDLLEKARQQEREKILKEIEEIVNKKFPRGERRWCIECARRIRTKLKQTLNHNQ